jgi:hypothetical protein
MHLVGEIPKWSRPDTIQIRAGFIGKPAAKARHAQWANRQIEWAYVTAAVVASIGYLYASTVPLVFAAPNLEKRFWEMFTAVSLSRAGLLDLALNVLAFVPLGFLWSAASSSCLPTNRRTRSVRGPVLIGSLGLATLGEALQFWIPLRTPSAGDILALECGAVIGMGLWTFCGSSATDSLGRCLLALYKLGGPRLFHLRWQILVVTTFLACLIVNCYASPTQLFLLYRFRSTSLHEVAGILHDASVQRGHGPLSAFLPSMVAALVIVAACCAALMTLKFLKTPGHVQIRRPHVPMRSLTRSAQ